MTVSAIDDPASVIINQNGIQGDAGANGTNGAGFNQVRKSRIDNPLVWLYKKNNLVRNLDGLLTVSRAVGGNYTDIYGNVVAADPDEPREESSGWLITSDETQTFATRNNIPLPDDGFTAVLELGYYLGGAVSQTIVSVPSTGGEVFTLGTDASNNFVATMQGSGLVVYSATSSTSSTISSLTTLIATYEPSTATLTLYIDGVATGTVDLPTGTPATIDVTGSSVVTMNGNFTLNMRGLRFYDFVLNSDEITFLS